MLVSRNASALGSSDLHSNAHLSAVDRSLIDARSAARLRTFASRLAPRKQDDASARGSGVTSTRVEMWPANATNRNLVIARSTRLDYEKRRSCQEEP